MMKNAKLKFDPDFFRYIMKREGITKEAIAPIWDVTPNHVNYKITNGIIDIEEAYAVLCLFKMTFEDLFKFNEAEKQL